MNDSPQTNESERRVWEGTGHYGFCFAEDMARLERDLEHLIQSLESTASALGWQAGAARNWAAKAQANVPHYSRGEQRMTKLDPYRPVQTRSGHPARIVCTDFKNENNPLVVLVSYRTGDEMVYTYRADGKFSGSGERHPEDLINVSLSSEEYVKKSGAVCPACGSNKTFYRQDSALGSLTRTVACRDCNATWTETLAVTGYLNLKVEEDGE